jgi:hypothetical protein
VHQAFLILTNKQTGHQATFIAEPLSSKGYAADINLEKDVASFNYASGDYDVALLIGDDSVDTPIEWNLVWRRL